MLWFLYKANTPQAYGVCFISRTLSSSVVSAVLVVKFSSCMTVLHKFEIHSLLDTIRLLLVIKTGVLGGQPLGNPIIRKNDSFC